LNIPTRIFRANQLQGLAADQRNGLGFNLADVSGRQIRIRIHKLALFSVAQDDMAEFMERSLVRELSQGIDCDASLERISLRISIGGLEINLLDAQLT